MERFLSRVGLDREVLLGAADRHAGPGRYLEALRGMAGCVIGHNREEHSRRERDWYQKSLATSGRITPERRTRVGDFLSQQDPETVEEKLRRSEAAVENGRPSSGADTSFECKTATTAQHLQPRTFLIHH